MSDIDAPAETEDDEGETAGPTLIDVYWLICSEVGTSRPIFLTNPPPRPKKSARAKRTDEAG